MFWDVFYVAYKTFIMLIHIFSRLRDFPSQQIHHKRKTNEQEAHHIVNEVLCVFSPSFLSTPRMIYALCTIKRMFGYRSLTCILL